jgi:hypothetical protein
LTVERAVAPEKMHEVALYEVVEYEGKRMKDVSVYEVIAMLTEEFKAHQETQAQLVDGMNNRKKQLKKCETEGCPQIHGHCTRHPVEVEPQFGFSTQDAGNAVVQRFHDVAQSCHAIQDVTTAALYNYYTAYTNRWDWLCILPACVMSSKYFGWFAIWYWNDIFKVHWRRATFTTWMLGLVMCLACPRFFPLIFVLCVYQQLYALSSARDLLMVELRDRRDAMPHLWERLRDRRVKRFCQGAAALACLYAISKVYRSYKKEICDVHSSLEPETEEELALRDSQANVWTTVKATPLPFSNQNNCSIPKTVRNVVETNLMYAEFSVPSGKVMANILFLNSNLCVLPDHYFTMLKVTELVGVCHKENVGQSGGSFKIHLSDATSEKIPGTDFRLCFCPTGGSFKEILHHLPQENMPHHKFTLLWRNAGGGMVTSTGTYEKREAARHTAPSRANGY